MDAVEHNLRSRPICGTCFHKFDYNQVLWCHTCGVGPSPVCDSCRSKHLEHDVGGHCDLHESILNCFCQTCQRLICLQCQKARHGDHEVVPYSEYITKSNFQLQDYIWNVGEQDYRPLVDKCYEVNRLKENFEGEKDRLQGVINQSYDSENDIKYYDMEIQMLERKLKQYRQQISEWEEEKRLAERRKELAVLECMKRRELLENLEQDFEPLLARINKSLRELKGIEGQMHELLGRGQMLTAEELPYPGYIGDVEEIKWELRCLSDLAKIDRMSPLKDSIKTLEIFGIDERLIKSRCIYARSASSMDLKIQHRDGDFNAVSITMMSKGRAVVAGGTRPYGGKIGAPWRLILLDAQTHESTVLTAEDIPIVSVRTMREDEVAVLRQRANPIVLVINVITNRKRELSVRLPEEVLGGLLQMEVVRSKQQFLLLYRENSTAQQQHLSLVDEAGEILQTICAGNGVNVCFNRITEQIVTCSFFDGLVSAFEYNQATGLLQEVCTARHGVARFWCWDMYSGRLGDIFIVGETKGDSPYETRIYQMMIEEGAVKMTLLDTSGVKLKSLSGQRGSVFRNKHAIAYGSDIKIFDMH